LRVFKVSGRGERVEGLGLAGGGERVSERAGAGYGEGARLPREGSELVGGGAGWWAGELRLRWSASCFPP